MTDLLGFVLPPFIDLINRKVKDSDLRFWVAVFSCILLASIMATVESNGFKMFTLVEILDMIAMKSMMFFGMSQLTYKKLWENSDIRSNNPIINLNAKTLN